MNCLLYTYFKKNSRYPIRIFQLICLTIFLSFFLSGCTPLKQTPLACTKIGCTDGIILQLNADLPSTAIIEITFDGESSDGESKTVSCSQGACLGRSIFVDDITPETFTVKITNNGSILAESSHSPTYTTNQPNGPDCPPKCKQAQISIIV